MNEENVNVSVAAEIDFNARVNELGLRCTACDLRETGEICMVCHRKCSGYISKHPSDTKNFIFDQNMVCAKTKGKYRLIVLDENDVKKLKDESTALIVGNNVIVIK